MLFRWDLGRQGTGYRKCLLAALAWPVSFDLYLIHYPEGSEIPWHTDPVKGWEHHRINLVLKAPKKGGRFECNGIFQPGRLHRLHPDIDRHRVTKIENGTRWVLSLGFLRRTT